MATLKKPAYLGNESLLATTLQRSKITANIDFTFFSKLCTLNTATVPFLDAMQLYDNTDDPTTFINYLKRFEDKKLLVIRHAIVDTELAPKYLQLCEQNSFEFLYEYINEYLIQGMFNPSHPLLTFKECSNQGVVIPQEQVVPFNEEDLVSRLKNLPLDPKIYSIPIHQNIYFCTDETIDKICSLIISRIQLQLSNSPQLANEVLKIFKENFSSFKDKFTSNNITIWAEIINKLHSAIPHLRAKKRLLEQSEFLDYVLILKKVVNCHATFNKETKKKETNISSLQTELEKEMLNHPQGKTQVDFNMLLNSLIEKYDLKENKEEVSKTIEKNLITPISELTAHKISGIIKFEEHYIHASVLASYISDRYFVLCDKLKQHYMQLMNSFLLHKLPSSNIIFFDFAELETSVRQLVHQMDELMYVILRNPVALASIIINANSKINTINGELNGSKKDMQNNFTKMSLSKQLSAFFNLRTKRLLNWYEIFNIDVVNIAKKSFANLNFFRKILLFFTNRYKYTLHKVQRMNSIQRAKKDPSGSGGTLQTSRFLQQK